MRFQNLMYFLSESSSDPTISVTGLHHFFFFICFLVCQMWKVGIDLFGFCT